MCAVGIAIARNVELPPVIFIPSECLRRVHHGRCSVLDSDLGLFARPQDKGIRTLKGLTVYLIGETATVPENITTF